MKRPLSRWLWLGLKIAAGLAVASLVAAHFVVPPMVDRSQNRVLRMGPLVVSAAAGALQARLTIADMHADSLIWGRALLDRNENRGQVDVPRLQDANVALQVFAVPTKVPSTRSSQGTSPAGLNLITLSALAQWWPLTTWWNLTERAQHVASILRKTAANSGGQLVQVQTTGDLDRTLAARLGPTRPIAAVLAVEGLHALEGKLQNVQRLFDAGFRMMGLVHQFDNDVGGSSSGISRGGLTPFGRDVVREMQRLGVIIDLAHASPQLIREVIGAVQLPLVVSHTGVRGTCDRSRNLSDEDVRAIAGTGGLIGIGFWAGAVCGPGAVDVARAIRYTANLVGVEHVALGSDFDGDRMPFDVRGLAAITEALMAEGFSEPEIQLMMGGNLIRLLQERLPRG